MTGNGVFTHRRIALLLPRPPSASLSPLQPMIHRTSMPQLEAQLALARAAEAQVRADLADLLGVQLPTVNLRWQDRLGLTFAPSSDTLHPS